LRTRARAGEINRERHDSDGAFHGVLFKRAGKTYVGRAALNGHVNDEVEFIRAGVTADDGGDATFAGSVPERVPSDDIVRSAVLSSSPSGVVYFRVHLPVRSPLGGSFGRSGSRNSNFFPSTKVILILVFFGEEVTIGNQKIRDLALFDGAGAVRYAKDFRRRKE